MPFDDALSGPSSSTHPVRYWNGAVVLNEADITVPDGGFFGHMRCYNNQTSSAYNGPNGWNWFVVQMPYLVEAGGSVAVVFDPNNPYWFDQTGSTYTARYGMVGVSLADDSGTNRFTFTIITSGRVITAVFNDFSAAAPGRLVSYTDARGITSTVISRDANQHILELQRGYTIGTTAYLDSLLYSYFSSGLASGKLQTVLYRQKIGGGSWNDIEQFLYGYHDGTDGFGSVNDLRTATRQLHGTGGWNTVAVDYYRYWLAGATTGFAHALMFHVGPEAYRLMHNAGIDLSTASDAAILPYADHYFEYDPYTWQVTQEISAVCPTCPGGGTTSDAFTYTDNPAAPTPGYNVWAVKTVQTLPDSSSITVYTNYIGQTMLYVQSDSTGTLQWLTFYRYDSNGQLIWKAYPSAVNGYDDTYDDLLNFDSGTGKYEYLNDTTGLIKITDYYSGTVGQPDNYVQNKKVQKGQSGSAVLVQSFTYSSNSDGTTTIYPIATRVSYPSATDPTVAITTSFSYAFFTGTNQIYTRTTTRPVISSGQNGDGSTPHLCRGIRCDRESGPDDR